MSHSKATYTQKRNFERTPEPQADDMQDSKPIFVIQKHKATNLHYDFRLAVEGDLKSWAVPKGPSTDTRVKRLAIATEDHPVQYADFEGVIPEGEYGAGLVLVWDRGIYRNLRDCSMVQSLSEGQVEVELAGEKLQGGYALVRTNKAKQQWLLIKMDDSAADARRRPVRTEPNSVISGKSLNELKAAYE